MTSFLETDKLINNFNTFLEVQLILRIAYLTIILKD